MSEPVTINLNVIARDMKLSTETVQGVINLLDQGLPAPFIARYRRDESDNLSEEKIRRIASQCKDLRQFTQRKEAIIRNIAASGKMTESLEKKILEARTKKRLDDLQLPFRVNKDTPATKARELGLEELATRLIAGSDPSIPLETLVESAINPDKGLAAPQDVLKAIRPLVVETLAGNTDARHFLRETIRLHGKIRSSRTAVHDTPPKVEADSTESRCAVAEESPASPAAEMIQPAGDLETPVVEMEKGTASAVTESLENGPAPDDAATEASSSEPESHSESTPQGTASVQGDSRPVEESGSGGNVKKAAPLTRRQKEKNKKNTAREKEAEARENMYREFYNYSCDIRSSSLYTILDLANAEKAGSVTVEIVWKNAKDRAEVARIIIREDHPYREFLESCVQEAIDDLLVPAMKKEIYSDLLQQSQDLLVRNLSKNLRNLLFRKALTGRRVLAFTPNFSRGCKLVALDEFGNVLAHDSVYITGSSERKSRASTVIRGMIDRFHLSVIAIGTGTGERDAQVFFSKMIQDHYEKTDLAYVLVDSVGAAAWSVCPAAREEFPACIPLVREAVSIGRRILNPVAELTRIDPLNLVVGLRMNESKPKNLKESLVEVIELAVNRLGVDLNRVEDTRLRYVSGLNNALAKRICEYRRKNGPFRRREELKNVTGITNDVYRNCVGFLRIPNGMNPLDATWIHPDDYPLACNILTKLGFTPDDLRDAKRHPLLVAALRECRFDDLCREFDAGFLRVREIVQQLSHPGEENRQEFVLPIFKRRLLKLDELEIGQEICGTITNIVKFGAFIDVGLLNSGLIHISHMGSNYVKSPQDKVSIGQVVRVWVIELDPPKHHLSLTLLSPEAEKEEQRKSRDRNRPEQSEASERVSGAVSGPVPESGREDRRGRDRQRDRHDSRSSREAPDHRGGGDRIARKPDGAPRAHTRDDGNRGRQDREGKFDRRAENAGKGRRNDRNERDRSDKPTRVVVAPKQKKITPLSEEMKNGKTPMRSFSDLAQLFGVVSTEESTPDKNNPDRPADTGEGVSTDTPENTQ